MPVQRTVSPIDGRLVAERELADAAAVARALERAGAAFPRWRATPVAERCALLSRAVDALVARRDAIAREITLQIGRPIAHSPGELRGFEERARHMLELAARGAGRRRAGAQARLPPLHPPRAPGLGPGPRALELPLPHRRERHHPGARRRQRGPAQALGADPARRRALAGGVRRGRACRRACSSTCTWATTTALELIAGGAVHLVAFTGSVGGGPCRRSRPRPARFIGHRPRARRQGPGLCPRTTPISPTRSRTWSTAPSSTPASAAAASSGSTSTSASTTPSSRAPSTLADALRAGRPARPRDDARPHGRAPRRRPRARAGRRGRAPGRPRADRRPAASRATGPARPTWRRSASSTSTTACA